MAGNVRSIAGQGNWFADQVITAAGQEVLQSSILADYDRPNHCDCRSEHHDAGPITHSNFRLES